MYLQAAGATFRGHDFGPAPAHGFKKLRAHTHGDVVLLLLESVAAGYAAATGVGRADIQPKAAHEGIAGKADTQSPEMARGMVQQFFLSFLNMSSQEGQAVSTGIPCSANSFRTLRLRSAFLRASFMKPLATMGTPQQQNLSLDTTSYPAWLRAQTRSSPALGS